MRLENLDIFLEETSASVKLQSVDCPGHIGLVLGLV